MSLAAAAGLVLLVATGAPACSSDEPAAFELPTQSFPDLVDLAKTRPADALAALERRTAASSSSPARDVLRARLLGLVGRHADSAAAWAAVATDEPSLRTFARRAAVRANLEAGQIDRARASLVSLMASDDPTTHTDLALMAAGALRNDGRHDEARALFADVLAAQASGARADEARLGRAASLAATGDRAAAFADLRRLRLTFTDFNTYEAAKRMEARLAADGRAPAPAVSVGEFKTMTERLVARSRYDEAIRLFEEWKEAEPGSAERLEAAIIDTLYRARENDKARRRIRQFKARWPRSAHMPDLTVLDFRIAIREADTNDVRRRGLAILRGQVQGVPAGDARGIGRLVGSYMAAVGRMDEALDIFREMFQSSRSASEQEDLLWRAGITALRAGDLERARSNLSGLIARNPGPETTRIARFWLADIDAREGRADAARATWRALVREQALDHYGLRAADRLEVADRLAGAPPAPDLSVRADTRNAPEMRAAEILAAAGMAGEAAAFLRQLAERLPSDLGMAYEAARASAAAGEFRAAHSLMARRFPSYMANGGRGLPPDFLKLFWPMAFESDIVEAAKRANIDPLIMLSIARRESRYDPGVRSMVGAIGLFQFMPYTARELAEPAGLTNVDEGALKTPRAAARLAATYLQELLRRFDGELAPAAASYNAGEDLASIWWKAHRSAGADLFLEMIPYTETRGYVREVVANYDTYRWIYGIRN